MTWVKKTFTEDFLPFLVLDTRWLWKIAEHFVSHDHYATIILPVVQQFAASIVIFHTAQLINLLNRKCVIVNPLNLASPDQVNHRYEDLGPGQDSCLTCDFSNSAVDTAIMGISIAYKRESVCFSVPDAQPVATVFNRPGQFGMWHLWMVMREF